MRVPTFNIRKTLARVCGQVRSGLTLFELVVVLAIMAALAGAAAVSTDRVISRRRSEITRDTLDAFRRSVLGRYGQAETISDGMQVAQQMKTDGFIADIGRLPMAVGADPTTQLAELWSNPNALAEYGNKTAAGDSEVTLACGWRGPYVDLPLGSTSLMDGFGRPMQILSATAGGTPQAAAAGDIIQGVTSLGSDGLVGVSTTEIPLAGDVTVWLSAADNMFLSDLTVRVYEADGLGGTGAPTQSGSVSVRLYHPDPNTGNIAFQQSPIVATPGTATFTFPDVPIGPKVLRAYWIDGGTESVSSEVTRIDVSRGGQTDFDLILPTLPTP